MDFIDQLREKQAKKRMSLRRFAIFLDAPGVDASYLSRLYRHQRGVTNSLVLAVVEKLPELKEPMFDFLRSALPKRDGQTERAITATPAQPSPSARGEARRGANEGTGTSGPKRRKGAA